MDAGIAEPRPGGRDGLGVPVDGQELEPRATQRFGMAAVAERAVHPPAGTPCRLEHGGHQYRFMIGHVLVTP